MTEKIAVGIALTTDPDKSRGLLDEFCRCLSDAAGIEVTAHGMWHYHHLLEELQEQQLDLVWLPPLLALRATAKRYCTPLALRVRHGVSTYSTALFSGPDSPIRNVADLKGASVGWVDRQSASGYLIIRASLRSKNVDIDEAFCDEKFLGTHDAVVDAVLSGEVDVGATFVYCDQDASSGAPKAAGWGDAAVQTICIAGPIPSDIIAANARMNDETKQLIRAALVEAKHPELARAACELLGASAFVAPGKAHLDELQKLLDNLEEASGPAHAVSRRLT